MSGRLGVRLSAPDQVGARVVGHIYPSFDGGSTVRGKLLPVGDNVEFAQFELVAGNYVVEAVLPSGQRVTDQVTVTDRESAELTLRAASLWPQPRSPIGDVVRDSSGVVGGELKHSDDHFDADADADAIGASGLLRYVAPAGKGFQRIQRAVSDWLPARGSRESDLGLDVRFPGQYMKKMVGQVSAEWVQYSNSAACSFEAIVGGFDDVMVGKDFALDGARVTPIPLELADDGTMTFRLVANEPEDGSELGNSGRQYLVLQIEDQIHLVTIPEFRSELRQPQPPSK